jgi:hypothetical protein
MLAAPFVSLCTPQRTNPGVQYRFELAAGIRVGKDTTGKQVAAKATIGANHFGPEKLLHLSESGLTRFDDSPGEVVGINDRNGAIPQKLSTGRFAHSHATSQAQELHDNGPSSRRQASHILREPQLLQSATLPDSIKEFARDRTGTRW